MGPYYGPLLLIPLIPVFFAIVVLPIVFSLLLLFEPSRHKIWATVLIVWWGLASAYLGGGAIISSLTSGGSTSTVGNLSWISLLYTAGSLTPFLALGGAVWGYYWHTGVNPRNWTPRRIAATLRGPAGHVRLAAMTSFVSSIFASPVLVIAPFVLVVGAVRLRNGRVRSRAHGLLLLAAFVANVVLLLAFEYVEYRNAWWEIGARVAGLVSLASTSLLGYYLIRWMTGAKKSLYPK